MANVLNSVLFHRFACQYQVVTIDMSLIPCQLRNRVICDLDSKADGVIFVKYYGNYKIKSVLLEVSYRTELN